MQGLQHLPCGDSPCADQLLFPAGTVGLWVKLPQMPTSLWMLFSALSYPGGPALAELADTSDVQLLLEVAAGVLTEGAVVEVFEMYSDVQPAGSRAWFRCPVLAVISA